MKPVVSVPRGGLAQERLWVSAMPGQSSGRAVQDSFVLKPLGDLANRASAPVPSEPMSPGLSPQVRFGLAQTVLTSVASSSGACSSNAAMHGSLAPRGGAAFVPALAGSMSVQRWRSVGEGSLPAASPLFGEVLFFTVLIITGLCYLPSLVLGPMAEQLSPRPAETTSEVVR